MCTQPRMFVPNAYYEVTSKGVADLSIFPNEELKSFFLQQLSISLKTFSFQCLSWSVMDDHYHLVLKSSDVTISKFMQRLNSVYAKRFNRAHKRRGAVFQSRFGSVIVQVNKNLRKVIRYVHLNPVRCGACTLDELDRYKWSGHKALANNQTDSILDLEEAYKQFNGPNQRQEYYIYVRSGKPDCNDDQIINKVRSANLGSYSYSDPASWVIGDDEFVRHVFELNRNFRVRSATHVREGVSIDLLHSMVCTCINRDKADLYRPGRLNEISTARQLFASVGVCHFGFSNIDLASYLGVTGSAVSRMVSRSKRITGLDFLKKMICS